MDGRTGFAVGGFIVGATAVAVACVVTMSNSSALADVPGRAAGVDTVRVSPSAPVVTPTPRASAPAAPSPEISTPTPPASAEVVPAPEPKDVSGSAAAPAAAEPQAVPAAPAQPYDLGLSKKEIEAEALRTGSWDHLRAWSTANGWSEERIERWIAVLQAKTVVNKESVQESYRTLTPAHAGNENGRSSSGLKRTQSPQPPRGD